MKNIFKSFTYCFLFSAITFMACNKDLELIKPNQPISNSSANWINSTVEGFIYDQNNEAIENVTIGIENGNEIETNQFGYFKFQQIQLNEKGSYIKAQKNGYFLGSRKFYPKTNKTSFIKIALIEQNFDQSFNSAVGATIQSENMVEITFPENAIEDANGNIYNGNVKIATTYLNPTEIETAAEMPGDLSAINIENEIGILNSYGMVNVVLQDDAGNKLNIADGKTVNIQMEVPTDLLSNAPQTIPLWTFDEENGIWMEEGFANLENGKYVGEVSHFSWWNCDVFLEAVYLDFTIVNENGIPLPNILTQHSLTNGGFTGSSHTNYNGSISGRVPANESILLSVFDNCGTLISSQTIGPFSSNTSLGNIEVSLSNTDIVNVTGELLDCNGSYVTNGIVNIQYGSITISQILSSNPFSFSFITCQANNNNIDLIAYDLNNFQFSSTLNYSINSDVNVGQIPVCEATYENYAIISNGISTTLILDCIVFNGTYYYDNFATEGYETLLYGPCGSLIFDNYILVCADDYNPENDISFFMTIPDTIPNTYLETYLIYADDYCNDTLTIDSFGAIGDKVIGSFNNIDSSGDLFYGSFNVTRAN